MFLRNRRPNRSYTKAGRLIKIEPKRAQPCQIIDGVGNPVPGFTSRKRARKVLHKLISVLEPGQPKRYVITNL